MDTDAYQVAAKLLSEASFIMIGAGAGVLVFLLTFFFLNRKKIKPFFVGMSVDSGLKTYGEVSDMDWFTKNNLTYRDLANPDLLVKNPDWFFAWAASCFDMFKAQAPHEGYTILSELRKKCIVNPYNEIIKQEIKENPFKPSQDHPGSFFVFTTNVDNFFIRAGFPKDEVCQTHGNYFQWQCSGLMREKHPFKFFNGPCHKATWTIPQEFEFNKPEMYDTSNMTCPDGPPKKSIDTWNSNRPKCPKCGLFSRPNVYQFGDQCFVENEREENNRANWLQAVEKITKRDKNARAVLLELGVGQRLPKIRVSFERTQKDIPKNQCVIIRVNPEVKVVSISENLIELPVGGLTALTEIWKHFPKN